MGTEADVSSRAQDWEVTQTREFTDRETEFMTRIWRQLLWPQGAGFAGRAVGWLWYGFAGFFLLSVVAAGFRLWPAHSDIVAQMAVSATGLGGCWISAYFLDKKFKRQFEDRSKRTGDRYRLEEQGLHIDIPDAGDFCGWRFISAMHKSDKWLVLLQQRGAAMMLARDAFEGQDFAAFADELERRWRAAKPESPAAVLR